MKKFLFILVFLSISTLSFSQFGITGGYSFLRNQGWQDNVASDENITLQEEYTNGDLALGIHYWFRLKNYRVEFLPELTYRSYDGEYVHTEIATPLISERVEMVGLHFNTQIYPLDLKGDCDCPTWSKEGPTLKKGLFINISPGVDWISTDSDLENNDLLVASKNVVSPNLGLGLGFDIGLSDFLTITPLAEYRMFFNEYLRSSDGTEGIKQLMAGVRVGFRFD